MMSIANPPSVEAIGAAESQPRPQPITRRASADWLPLLGWFVEQGALHSRINVIPAANTLDPAEPFSATLKFFRGAPEPVHVVTSPPFSGDQTFRYEGAELLAALGLPAFDGLVEITVRSLSRPPAPFPWADSWFEFYAEDGSFSGSVPGFVFKGGTTKRVMSGKWQHWPGIAASAEYASTLLLLNYHPRPVEARLDLFAPSGASLSSPAVALAPHLPRRLELEEVVPGARRLLEAEGGFGSLRVWSTYKLPGFVAMRRRDSGVTVAFDHTVPFAGPPVD